MRAPVAIEITEQWIKFVAVRNLGKKARLFKCLLKPVSSFTDEQIVQTITEILRELKLKPDPLIICFPRNQMTLRTLHLPSADVKEIAQMIDLNIARIVPYRKDEVISSFQLSGVDDAGYSIVILAIVHRDLTHRLLKIMEQAGLFIKAILLSSSSVWEWTLSNDPSELVPNELYLLLDIDSAFTDFILFTNHHLLFSRSIVLSSKQILEQEGISKLIAEVKDSLVIFQKKELNKKPAKVFLSGATVGIENLNKVIEKELEIPVKIVPSAYSLEKPRIRKEDVPGDVSVTAVSEAVLGKSDRKITFSLPEIQVRQSLRERTKDLTLLGSLCICLLAILFGIFLSRLYTDQHYLAKIKEKRLAIEKEIGDFIHQAKKIELVKDYLVERRTPAFFLYQVQKVVPNEIAILSISLDQGNKVTLRGHALQLSDVFKFTTTLEKTQYFKEIQTDYTRKKWAKDKEITEFQLTLRFDAR